MGEWRHRLLGLRLSLPGLEPVIVVSAYLQANGGMGEVNRELLALTAQWQEQTQQPLLIGGDFRSSPSWCLVRGFRIGQS